MGMQTKVMQGQKIRLNQNYFIIYTIRKQNVLDFKFRVLIASTSQNGFCRLRGIEFKTAYR